MWRNRQSEGPTTNTTPSGAGVFYKKCKTFLTPTCYLLLPHASGASATPPDVFSCFPLHACFSLSALLNYYLRSQKSTLLENLRDFWFCFANLKKKRVFSPAMPSAAPHSTLRHFLGPFSGIFFYHKLSNSEAAVSCHNVPGFVASLGHRITTTPADWRHAASCLDMLIVSFAYLQNLCDFSYFNEILKQKRKTPNSGARGGGAGPAGRVGGA